MSILSRPKRVARSQLTPGTIHLLKNLALIVLSIIFLPLNTSILLWSYGLRLLRPLELSERRRLRSSPSFYPKTILVTGVGMEKGLCLARMFYEAGHDVIGADFEPDWVPVRGRASCALKRFYRVSMPDGLTGAAVYIRDLQAIVRREKVDLWVSCAGQSTELEDAQAKEVIERRTHCKVIQLDARLIEIVHPKDSFIQYVASLGLNVPETHPVTSRGAVHKLLNSAPAGRQYILKPDGIDNAPRGELAVLPRRTMSETYNHVSSINISPTNPWVVQQFVRGKEYCTHALVVKGEIKAFVACPSTQLLMHYEAIPAKSALSEALLEFNQEFAARSSNHEMTGHLALDFMVEERPSPRGVETTVYPIECNPRAHTAVVLFNGRSKELTDAYLSALTPEIDGAVNGYESHIVSANESRTYYWVGHDLVMLLLLPLFQFVIGRLAAAKLVEHARVFLRHLLFWHDGTYAVWDPLPWWWLYHVYWPGKFAMFIWYGKAWSQLNVSTVRTFDC